MPSVFTIEGADLGEDRDERKHKCKWVKNPRTGCEVKLCYVGKGKSRTGWKFEKGSTRCPTRQR